MMVALDHKLIRFKPPTCGWIYSLCSGAISWGSLKSVMVVVYDDLPNLHVPSLPYIHWWGSNSVMPMFKGFWFMERAWALANSTASDRNRAHTRVYPGSAPQKVKIYILLVWSCIDGIVGAVTMVALMKPGYGKKRWRVLAYVHGGDGICARLDFSILPSRPSSPLYGGRGLGIWSKSVTGDCEP
jgi:hypothetical protein